MAYAVIPLKDTDSDDLHIDTVTLKHCQIIWGRENIGSVGISEG